MWWLDEVIYVHPRAELAERGMCWQLRNALYRTRKATQRWGETVRAAFDSCLPVSK